MSTGGNPAHRGTGTNGARTLTRDNVRQLLALGLTVGEAARTLGISAAAVSYHRRKLGLPPSAKYAPRGDWDEIQRLTLATKIVVG